MDFHINFKSIFLLILFMLIGCSNLKRNNILDPKNKESVRPQRVMIEAFVNVNSGTTPVPPPYNLAALEALDSLMILYPDQIVIAEYHRNTGANGEYKDSYHLSANNVIYQTYLQALGVTQKRTPDIFINGIEARVEGASDAKNVLDRLEAALSPLLAENSYFTIEASVNQTDNLISPMITLARLGTEDAENLIIRAVLITEISHPYLARVVLGSSKSTTIDLLKNAETKEITLPDINTQGKENLKLIVYVTNQQETMVYQCMQKDI